MKLVDTAVLSIFRDIVAILGVVGGFTYYVMNVRATKINQRHAEETRKVQLMLGIEQNIRGQDLDDWQIVMNIEWTDYDDFISKYGYDKNREIYNKRMKVMRNMNISGLLIRDELLDISTYVDYIGSFVPDFWNKFKPIIEEQRILFDNPNYLFGIEHLAKEIDKYRLSKGLAPLINV